MNFDHHCGKLDKTEVQGAVRAISTSVQDMLGLGESETCFSVAKVP